MQRYYFGIQVLHRLLIVLEFLVLGEMEKIGASVQCMQIYDSFLPLDRLDFSFVVKQIGILGGTSF
jgi:hypothetical protein